MALQAQLGHPQLRLLRRCAKATSAASALFRGCYAVTAGGTAEVLLAARGLLWQNCQDSCHEKRG